MLSSILFLLPILVAGSVYPDEDGVPVRSKAGRLGDDELYHWGNRQFEVSRSDFVVGSELILVGGYGPAMPDGIWNDCVWRTPSGDDWKPQGEVVVDSNGNPVEGVEGWGSDPQKCGIRIISAEEKDAGNWYVRTTNIPTVGGFFNLTLSLNTADEVSTDLRLPNDFDPLEYDVGLIPELNSSATEPFPGQRTVHRFQGWSTMFLRALTEQPWITFHSDELEITGLQLFDWMARRIDYDQIGVDFQRTLVYVHNSEGNFEIGRDYLVMTTFNADLDRGAYYTYGFYHRACNDFTDVHCWYTQFESTNARNAFPCLDEPGFKANFTMSVGRNEAFQSRSNMPLKETTHPEGTDYVFDVYSSSVEMSPYLVAVAVHNYKGLESGGEPFHTVWASEEDVASGKADYAAMVGPSVLSFYEEHFGVKYPLPKMDLMYEPHKGGAMENWGLILFDERALLIDPESTDDDFRFQVLNIIAHEVAHQWFGNLVTCKWWSQTWLNEGFAVFVSYIGSHHVDPEAHSWERMYVKDTQRVMFPDENIDGHWAMTDPVADRSDIERKFGKFTYQKGGAVIRMMEQMIGMETLAKGLNYYLTAMAYSAAVEDDLFTYLEQAAKEDGAWPPANGPQGSFGDTMKTWTQQAGLPLVTARKECAATGECTVSFEQEMLVRAGQQADQERRWDIPLTFSPVTSDARFDAFAQDWLVAAADGPLVVDTPQLTKDTPFLVNIDVYGYYRVTYDEASWLSLAETLRTDFTLIPPLNRAQIICDILSLERSGHVSTELKEEVLSYLGEEDDFAPILAFERCSAYVKEDFTDNEAELFRI